MTLRPSFKTLDGRRLNRDMVIELLHELKAYDRLKTAAHILVVADCAKANGVPGSREAICEELAAIAEENRDMALYLGSGPVKWQNYEFWVPPEEGF